MNRNSEITVPSTLNDKSPPTFFGSWHWPPTPGRKVTLDLTATNFIAPWGLVLFGAYGVWLKEHKKKQISVKVNPNTVAGSFAVRAGFLDLLGEPAPVAAAQEMADWQLPH